MNFSCLKNGWRKFKRNWLFIHLVLMDVWLLLQWISCCSQLLYDQQNQQDLNDFIQDLGNPYFMKMKVNTDYKHSSVMSIIQLLSNPVYLYALEIQCLIDISLLRPITLKWLGQWSLGLFLVLFSINKLQLQFIKISLHILKSRKVYTDTHTNTQKHMHAHTLIYKYVCVCVCARTRTCGSG